MRELLLLVDGANVVGSRPDGWWRDRGAAARRLRDLLAARVEAGLPAAALPEGVRGAPAVRVALVVEGQARRGVPAGSVDGGRLEVVHAPGSGDDELVVAARAHRPPVLAVTADRALRARLLDDGVVVVGPGWLWGLLDTVAGPADGDTA